MITSWQHDSLLDCSCSYSNYLNWNKNDQLMSTVVKFCFRINTLIHQKGTGFEKRKKWGLGGNTNGREYTDERETIRTSVRFPERRREIGILPCNTDTMQKEADIFIVLWYPFDSRLTYQVQRELCYKIELSDRDRTRTPPPVFPHYPLPDPRVSGAP